VVTIASVLPARRALIVNPLAMVRDQDGRPHRAHRPAVVPIAARRAVIVVG